MAGGVEAEIQVVSGNMLSPGTYTPGIMREVAFDTPSALFSRTRIPGGNISGWHHHGDRVLFGYLLEGRLTLEFGTHGSKSATIEQGDFFRIPIGLIHRDINPEKAETVVVSLLAGGGPVVVSVSDPD